MQSRTAIFETRRKRHADGDDERAGAVAMAPSQLAQCGVFMTVAMARALDQMK